MPPASTLTPPVSHAHPVLRQVWPGWRVLVQHAACAMKACTSATQPFTERMMPVATFPFCRKTQSYVPTNDHLACQQCDSSSGFLYDTVNGYGTSMTWVGSSTIASGSNPPTLQCACPASSLAVISATVLNAGAFQQRCITCPSGYRVCLSAAHTWHSQPESPGKTGIQSLTCTYNAFAGWTNKQRRTCLLATNDGQHHPVPA